MKPSERRQTKQKIKIQSGSKWKNAIIVFLIMLTFFLIVLITNRDIEKSEYLPSICEIY